MVGTLTHGVSSTPLSNCRPFHIHTGFLPLFQSKFVVLAESLPMFSVLWSFIPPLSEDLGVLFMRLCYGMVFPHRNLWWSTDHSQPVSSLPWMPEVKQSNCKEAGNRCQTRRCVCVKNHLIWTGAFGCDNEWCGNPFIKSDSTWRWKCIKFTISFWNLTCWTE